MQSVHTRQGIRVHVSFLAAKVQKNYCLKMK